MALSDTNRADIRYYLGFTYRFQDTYSILEGSMSGLDSDPEAEVQVLADIVRLKAIDVRIEASYDRLKALKVCDITVAGRVEICALKSEGRRIVGRIASTLGVPVIHDIFGGGTPPQAGRFGPIGGGNFGLHG